MTPSNPHSLPRIEGISQVYAPALHRGAVRDALHALKYENTPQVAAPLAAIMARTLPFRADVILPIPLHAARLQERGYNQAAVIAEALGQLLDCPVENQLLARTKATASQVTLSAAERRTNLVDAFTLQAEISVPGSVMLVDDVCTTGSTLGAAAQVLRAAGVAQIYAATVSTAQ